MTLENTRKSRLLALLGRYVLENGLEAASLRPLAKAAETSDRMLIYYFGSKSNLLLEVVQYLAIELRRSLSDLIYTKEVRTNADCVTEILSLLRRDPYRQYITLWFEIAAKASRGDEPLRAAGHNIIQDFNQWIEALLPEKDHKGPEFYLALIDGILFLEAFDQTKIAKTALQQCP